MIYEVITIYNGDEFSEGVFTDKEKAVDAANWAYNRGDLARRRRTVVEVRVYDEDAYAASMAEYDYYAGDYDIEGRIDGVALNGDAYTI